MTRIFFRVTSFSLGIMCFSLIASLLSGASVQAACSGGSTQHSLAISEITTCTNLAPAADLKDVKEGIVDNGWWIAYSEWLSQQANPTIQSISVPYGTDDVALQYNAFVYRRKDNLRRGVSVHVIDSNATELKGKTFTFSYPTSDGYYIVPAISNRSFNYDVSSISKTPGSHVINITMKTKGVQKTSEGKYICVKVGSSEGDRYVSSYTDDSRCTAGSSTFKITITVGTHWSATGTTAVKVNGTAGATTASPGDKIVWTHQLKNDGPAKSASIESKTENSGFSDTSYNGTKNNVTGTMDSGATRTPTDKTEYIVREDDIGGTLCQQLKWTPTNSSGGKNGTSTNTCITIPYDYSLTPSVGLDKTIADAGATLQVDAKIGNSGTTKTDSIDWQLSYITIPAGDSTPPAGTSANTSTPCAYYKSKVATITCDIATFTDGDYITATGTNVFSFTSGTYSFSPRIATVPDLPVGTKLCYALSVKPYESNSTDWRHSSPACAVIGKHPVLQTYGGDVIVGRDGSSPASKIITSTKTVSGKRYGSWGEYGVIAAGSVSGMASASGYAGGSTTTNICDVSYLTLNNRTNPTSSCSTSTLGSYAYGAAASSVAARFAITSSTPQKSGNVTVSSLSSGATYTNNASGSEIRLTMGSPATLPAGKWVVINAPNATVKIMGDLRYTTDSLAKLSDIPQLVIIAKNIIVSDSVTQIDAWLVATGTGTEGRINTCGAGSVTEASAITSKTCDKKLTVNGPTIANHLVLRRTAGAGTGTASGNPAEVFNLRPDSYLWALSLQTSTPKAQTVQTVELPPRY